MADPYEIEQHPRGPEEIKRVAHAFGYRAEDLSVLIRQLDPFNSGGPADQRTAEWFAGMWQRFEYVRAHMRRMHYQILSSRLPDAEGRPYENTEANSNSLYKSGSKARDLDLVDTGAMDDRRNPPPILNMAPPDEEWWQSEPDWDWTEPEPWEIPSDLDSLDYLARLPSFELGSVDVSGYGWDPGDAPVLIEVWIEKTTQDDWLVPLCEELNINLVRFAGFSSEIRIAEMLGRAKAFGRPVRIHYVSDFDPAGGAMHVAVARNIEFYRDRLAPEVDIALTRVLLTREQVDRYQLPRVPIKAEDVRKKRFEELNGEGAVELDALEALHPGEPTRIIREAVEPYLDPEMQIRVARARGDARRAAAAAFREATADIRDELNQVRDEVRDLAEDLAERLEPIEEEYDRRLEPIRRWYNEACQPLEDELQRIVDARADQLTALREQLDETASDLHVSLPGRPEGEWQPADDEDDWLYRSDRHWWDQLGRYHREQGRVVESRTRDCMVCGTTFTPARSDARFCSSRCRDRNRRQNGGVQ